MTQIELLVDDPRVRIVETELGEWVFSGVDPSALGEAVHAAETVAEARQVLQAVAEDAVAVRVGAGRVDAYRSVSATRELYYANDDGNRLTLADNFRNALTRIPADNRTVPPGTVADHLLFRAPIEPSAYVDEIQSLEQGAWLTWEGTESPTVRHQEVIRIEPSVDPADAPDMIDGTLQQVLEAGIDGDTTNMFSGGVDSTLLQTYLQTPSVSMAIDTPELAFERRYIRETEGLLDGGRHRTIELAEANFLEWLEESMDLLGYPSHYAQTVLTHALFERDNGQQYVNGEGADALFGLTGAKGARLASWLQPLLRRVPLSLLRTAPGSVQPHLMELHQLAAQFDRPLSARNSFPNRFAFFTHPDVVGEMVGEGLVDQRFRTQYNYVNDRFETVPYGPFATNVEFAHLLCFLRHNTVNQWRQLAHAHGKSLFAPFKTASLLKCALSVPADRRYIQGIPQIGQLDAKYLLKRLLARRLPAYPTGQEKGSGSLPLGRFFANGVLADVFERYSPPEFVPDSMVPDHVASFGPVTWNLVTYAVWRDRVLTNPALEPLPETRLIERAL